jgi:hypothetical protein
MKSNKRHHSTLQDENKGCKLIYLKHKEVLNVYGSGIMRVVFGSVKIHGYITRKLHEPIPIYAVEHYGILPITVDHIHVPSIPSKNELKRLCT